ncbi:chitobiase/beta-hexosaminidase C-terminal domain-containing protein [Fulvivirgaceae bacterium BMA10]|uniref:Chitobiase/beta-hexosaminidase C-terminal domain-containing protein n=2 Tax=Splendidivirga corallicola TaxID=3051826 RepID=A0ABT8KQJ1_9BACT|nr:chitobiase/beta-hexosaminidase C-terminal domain-containing protein [Fulvivirgaceae bacterium BMA10]
MWDHYKEGEKIRYIANRNGDIYVASLEWPGSSFQCKYITPNKNSAIRLLGHNENLSWKVDHENGLTIQLPESLQQESNRPCMYAYVFKMQGVPASVATSPIISVRDKQNVETEIFSDEIEVELIPGQENTRILYSLDGSEPNESSQTYSEPIKINKTTVLKAITSKDGYINSPTAKIHLNKAAFNNINLSSMYNQKYSAGGTLGLLDGQHGSTKFTDGKWQGFEGVDFEAVIDMGQKKDIKIIKTGFLQDLGPWIFPPILIEFAVSDDGKNYETVASFQQETPKEQSSAKRLAYEKKLSDQRARYVKVFAKNIGTCPPWHSGSGGKAWLFVDEISIN